MKRIRQKTKTKMTKRYAREVGQGGKLETKAGVGGGV